MVLNYQEKNENKEKPKNQRGDEEGTAKTIGEG